VTGGVALVGAASMISTASAKAGPARMRWNKLRGFIVIDSLVFRFLEMRLRAA
jgi:hypothetical protein